MTEKKSVNYTEAQTEELVTAYESCVDAEEREECVQNFSAKFAKGVRSIRQKLVTEKVYIKKVYKTKTGEKVETKDAIVTTIAKILDVTEDQLGGLSNATKPALELIRQQFIASAAALALADSGGVDEESTETENAE